MAETKNRRKPVGRGRMMGLVTEQPQEIQAISSLKFTKTGLQNDSLVCAPFLNKSKSRSRVEPSLEVAVGKPMSRTGTADWCLTSAKVEGRRKEEEAGRLEMESSALAGPRHPAGVLASLNR